MKRTVGRVLLSFAALVALALVTLAVGRWERGRRRTNPAPNI